MSCDELVELHDPRGVLVAARRQRGAQDAEREVALDGDRSSSNTPCRQNATCTFVHVRQSGASIGRQACACCAVESACTNVSVASAIGAVGTGGARGAQAGLDDSVGGDADEWRLPSMRATISGRTRPRLPGSPFPTSAASRGTRRSANRHDRRRPSDVHPRRLEPQARVPPMIRAVGSSGSGAPPRLASHFETAISFVSAW